ncbi:HAD family phosphatase [Romeria aff. gracilis LEGE 07310]|uniref:HAD family phosphatase n=1 Tax=Vasconcelosia minhoensis LEGE 07310 TaxID=915328 RepID=A0A8J7A860_9CYAN|nr:HAD family phosphatase [Romeria gracilis]MBE9077845.1 HAD family phosphatase [Romeria aff. gracilis LEGE 07310]
MALKAVLFNFNGVIINDEAVHQRLVDQLLLEQNLRPDPKEYAQVCLGRSDRACLRDLLAQRDRVITDADLERLLTQKTAGYQDWLSQVRAVPTYPGLEDLIFRARAAQLKMAVVTGAQRIEVEQVLARTEFAPHFSVIVAGDELPAEASKPAPDGYLQAIERLNQQYPELGLRPDQCVAVEDTFVGIDAAKNAGIPVVGVAHTLPNHMLQRTATWVVDYLSEVELEWVGRRYE